VSQTRIEHLQALESHGRVLPVVNQIEMHPLNWKEREDLLNYCASRNIIVQAYGSLFAGKEAELTKDYIMKIATAMGRTNAQVLLRWGYQRGFQTIPKSKNVHRLVENSHIFDFNLSEEQMGVLNGMKGELGAYWQPLTSPVDLGDVERYRFQPKQDL